MFQLPKRNKESFHTYQTRKMRNMTIEQKAIYKQQLKENPPQKWIIPPSKDTPHPLLVSAILILPIAIFLLFS